MAYSIEQAKLKSESDKTIANAEAKKQDMRDKIGDLRRAFKELLDKNDQLVPRLRLEKNVSCNRISICLEYLCLNETSLRTFKSRIRSKITCISKYNQRSTWPTESWLGSRKSAAYCSTSSRLALRTSSNAITLLSTLSNRPSPYSWALLGLSRFLKTWSSIRAN